MGLFPYNSNKFVYYTPHLGSPMTKKQAELWAQTIMDWHAYNKTDDWSQSCDGHQENVHDLAFGLITMMADPGFIRMLQIVGRSTVKSCNSLLKWKEEEGKLDPVFEDALKQIKKLGE